MEGLLKRLVSGLVLVPVVISIVLFTPAFWFAAVTLLVTVLSLSEYNGIVFKADAKGAGLLWIIPGALVPVAIYFMGYGASWVYMAATILFFFVVAVLKRNEPSPLKLTALRFLSVFYVGFFISHFILLRDMPQGRWWVLFVFAVVSLNDTAAYYGGRALGKHKLAPVISPKKTIEGAVCGLVGGIVGAFIFVNIFAMNISSPLIILVIALLLGVAGIFGDLAESLIKRRFDVKDSGTLIPGHGGILDRIDGVIFAMPVLFYLLSLRETFGF